MADADLMQLLRENWLVILLVAVVAVYGLTNGRFSLGAAGIPTTPTLPGGCVLSLSPAVIQSSNALFNNKNWVTSVTIGSGCNTKLIGGSADSNELQSITQNAGTSVFKSNLDLTYSLDKELAVYKLDKSGFSVYQYNPVSAGKITFTSQGALGLSCSYSFDGDKWASPRGYISDVGDQYSGASVDGSGCGIASDSSDFYTDYKHACSSILGAQPLYTTLNIPSTAIFGGKTNSKVWKCMLPNAVPVASVYSLESPTFQWQVTLQLSNSEGKDMLVLTQDSSASFSSANNFWGGFAGAANSLSQLFPSETAASAIKNSNGTIALVSSINYNDVITSNSFPFVDEMDWTTWQSTLTNRQNAVIRAITAPPVGNQWNTAIVDSNLDYASIDAFNLQTNPPYYPIISLYVNASWLGIGVLQSIPVLDSATCAVQAGNGGAVTATYHNNGDSTADMKLDLICPQGGFLIQSDSSFTVTAGTTPVTKSFGLLSSGAQKDMQETCVVKLSDVADSSISVQQSVTCGITAECKLAAYNSFIVDYADTNKNGITCELICPLTKDFCATSGQAFDPSTCSCIAPNPSSSVPPAMKCTDGTALGQCGQTSGYRCNSNGQLVADSTCKGTPTGGACGLLTEANPTTGQCQLSITQLAIVVIALIAILYLLTQQQKK